MRQGGTSALFTTPITSREREQLEGLAKIPDARIDFSDAPEAKQPTKVHVGRFYGPIKQPIG